MISAARAFARLAPVLALALVAGPCAHPAAAKPNPTEYKLRIRQILLQMQKEAMEQVSLVMEDVRAWLGRYCQQHDHFPSDDLESGSVTTRLLRLMPANPYIPSNAPVGEQRAPVSADERMKIVVQVDRRLDLEWLKTAQDTPPDSWQAPAGTVTVISDGYHLAAIWAAGADQRPIRDRQSGKVLVLIARCGR